jgi:mono/diheme cytochrome c family protein
MRILFILALGLQSAASPPKTMSELMIDPIYPASDAIFYISTRTPATDAEWRVLEQKTSALADAAAVLTTPLYFRDRARWMSDAKLLVNASTAAVAAAKKHDIDALANLNGALYTSCVQCHQDYRPGYGRPAGSPQPSVPSLEGVWNFSTVTPLERPAEFSGKPTMTEAEAKAYEKRIVEQSNRDRRSDSPDADVANAYNEFWWDRGTHVATVNGKHLTSLVVDPADGRIPPPTDAARQRAGARAAERRQHPADGPEDRSLGERCLSFNAGPPMMSGPYNNYVQIFQRPDRMIVYNEMIHDARVIPIDADAAAAHLPKSIRKWQGDSRAHWEGSTLIVDTTNFTDKTSFRGTDENLHLVERFTRTGANTLLYEFTVDDPTAFTKPWTVSLPMAKTTDRIFEYACHEGNYALENILRGARDEEKRKP